METLYLTLQNDSGLTSIFGTAVYNTLPPDGTRAPYIIFQLIDETPDSHLAGFSSARLAFQIDCYCSSVAQAESAWDSLRAALIGQYVIGSVAREYNPATNQFRITADVSTINTY